MENQILITTTDMDRLERLVAGRPQPVDRIAALEQELERADVVEPERISGSVVTMNSRVRIRDLDRDQELVCTLVYPADANAEQNRVSVLAPLGTALLGARVGHSIAFETPGGTRRVQILAIEYQPEAAARNAESAVTPVAGRPS